MGRWWCMGCSPSRRRRFAAWTYPPGPSSSLVFWLLTSWGPFSRDGPGHLLNQALRRVLCCQRPSCRLLSENGVRSSDANVQCKLKHLESFWRRAILPEAPLRQVFGCLGVWVGPRSVRDEGLGLRTGRRAKHRSASLNNLPADVQEKQPWAWSASDKVGKHHALASAYGVFQARLRTLILPVIAWSTSTHSLHVDRRGMLSPRPAKHSRGALYVMALRFRRIPRPQRLCCCC